MLEEYVRIRLELKQNIKMKQMLFLVKETKELIEERLKDYLVENQFI